jgi:tetratricopeptide (TPR) repeat protein
VEKTRPADEHDEWDILDALNGIQHPDVDNALFHQRHEDPMYQPWTIWGFKSDKTIKIDPQDAAFWCRKGDDLFETGNYIDAIKAYDRALELNPTFVDVWVIESAIFGTTGKYVESVKACDKAIELDPKNVFAWGNKGEALKDLGQYEDAVQALDMALELDPTDADVWHIRSETFKSLGRNEEADAAFTKSMELGYTGYIENTFAEHFAHWKITLPQEDLNDRCSGHIFQAGWLIQYCFGKDDTCGYMDYYATHRMTNDRHVRIYANGREEQLPAFISWCPTGDDPVKAKQLTDECYRQDYEVVMMLLDKGFNIFPIERFTFSKKD